VTRGSEVGGAPRALECPGVRKGSEAVVLARRDSEAVRVGGALKDSEGGVAWRSLKDSGGCGNEEVSVRRSHRE
jgi:hypothetical protein